MDPVQWALLRSWGWRADVSLVLLTAALLYGRGWLQLRRRGYHRLARRKGLALYLSGLATIAVALMSPIDTLQALLFSVHMFQHQLLIYLAPPLLLAARPLPFVLWGIPVALRLGVADLLTPSGLVRRSLAWLTQPAAAYGLSTGILWLWHIPAAYNFVLVNGVAHDVQHLTFFGSALLYWWALIGSPPQAATVRTNSGRALFLALGAVQSALLGGLITFADRVIYTNYLMVPRFAGISAQTDQVIAGALMWFPGPFIFGLAAALLMQEE